MSKEGKDYELGVGTEKIAWVFAPLYNDTPTTLEWFIDYSIDTCVECDSWDMSKLIYCIYNYNTSTWTDIDGSACHFFYGDVDGNAVYVGHLTRQMAYYKLNTSVTNYISDDGYVKIGMRFDFATDTKESEIHYTSGNTTKEEYVNRTSVIRVFYNAVFLY